MSAAIRRLIVAGLAAVLLAIGAANTVPSSSEVSTAQAVQLVASERVAPKVTVYWIGYQLDFTATQTRAVALGAAIATVWVPGVGWITKALASAGQAIQFVAQEATAKNKCLRIGATWLNPFKLKVTYTDCWVK